MLAAWLTFEETTTWLLSYPNTVLACYNSIDGVTLNGPEADILDIQAELLAQNRLSKIVPTDKVAYHSLFSQQRYDQIYDVISKAIRDTPVLRSARWLSTSASGSLYADASYHTANIAVSKRVVFIN